MDKFDFTLCPLLEKKIEDAVCFDIHMNVEGLAPDWTIPPGVLAVENYKEICLSCPNHRE